ncbi:MAG: D-2-hydroxyacid dehydrogenase [Chloroflexota bacterium]
MEAVNLVLTYAIGAETRRRIADLSPRVKLHDAADLVLAERNGDFSSREQLDAMLAEAEIIYGFRLPTNVISRAPGLKWIQTMLAGVDHILDSELLNSPVILTNSGGLHGTSMSEFALHLMLMFAKGAPRCFELKQSRKWERFSPAMLRSQTAGIIGLGKVGHEVARLAKACGMRVVAVDAKRLARARYVNMVLPPERLGELLKESDFVIITLPLTPETRNLMGEAQFRAMKPGAYFINIGRGAIADEAALVHALEEKWISGAGLDAFATEPLPPDSRLWDFPNVIFSPHIAGTLPNYPVAATELFLKNLRHYLEGRKLFNIVNKQRGY